MRAARRPGARGDARRCADHDRRRARARRRVEPGAASFIEHDAFQCGYSTSGQPCCAAALRDAFAAGDASAAAGDVRHRPVQLSDDEIRERMSGNLCRCGASPNIAAAVRAAHATTTFARGGNAVEAITCERATDVARWPCGRRSRHSARAGPRGGTTACLRRGMDRAASACSARRLAIGQTAARSRPRSARPRARPRSTN